MRWERLDEKLAMEVCFRVAETLENTKTRQWWIAKKMSNFWCRYMFTFVHVCRTNSSHFFCFCPMLIA